MQGTQCNRERWPGYGAQQRVHGIHHGVPEEQSRGKNEIGEGSSQDGWGSIQVERGTRQDDGGTRKEDTDAGKCEFREWIRAARRRTRDRQR